MQTKQKAEGILRKMFQGGLIKRMPKNHDDALFFLALAASSFDSQCVYSESEVNHHLVEWLVGFTQADEMDHVTVRRYLVDFQMLMRDASGTEYRTNQTVINNVIEPAGRSIQPRYVMEAVRVERLRRKRAATKTPISCT